MNSCTNTTQPLLRRLIISRRPLHLYYSTTSITSAMKAGTQIPGLDSIYPASKGGSGDSSAPIVKERSEYPKWVSSLAEAPPTLAKLRNMKMEDASDKDMKRYLKLVRRIKIKDNNAIAGI